MELCQELHDGLAIAGDSKRISDDEFDLIIKEIKNLDNSNSDCRLDDSNGEVKLSLISILTLLVEAAKNNLSEQQLNSLIDSDGHLSKRKQIVIDCYKELKIKLREQLSRQRLILDDNRLSKIIDCHWSQQYLVKSSNQHKIGEVNYLVKIKTDKQIQEVNGEDKELLFEASLQELQDLTLKLREAAKVVERIFNRENESNY